MANICSPFYRVTNDFTFKILEGTLTDKDVNLMKNKIININEPIFTGCSLITTANFPKCTSIGNNAFCSCSSLTTASFPVCTNIESYAFQNCSSLTTISFPVCTNIGDKAFKSCYSLTSLYFLSTTIPTLALSVFESTPLADSSYIGRYASIYVKSSKLSLFKTAKNWSIYSARMVGV